MRVLFVLPRMLSGGVERVVLNLITQFVRDGIECKIALRHSCGELLQEACSLVEVKELAPRGLHQFVPNLASLIRTWQPTHVVTAFADVATLTWLAMRIAKSSATWVHGVHNTHEDIAAGPGIFGRSRHWLDKRFAAFVYQRADKVIAVSDGLREEVIRHFMIDPSRVVRIYNPVIPEDKFQPRSAGADSAHRLCHIVAIGRLVRQKGFDILIKAMEQVPQPWRLDIYGEGPERARLEKLISARNLGFSVKLLGYTKDAFAALRTADLFVLSSRHEGLPTVLIEALACQCQVVSTDCPQGPREILRDGKLGQLVPIENPAALARAIERAVSRDHCVAPERLLNRARAFSLVNSAESWRHALLACGPGAVRPEE